MYTTKELCSFEVNPDLPLQFESISPAKIFDMVVKGLPISGLARNYPDDDDPAGIDEDADPEVDYRLIDELEARHTYYEDDIQMLQALHELQGQRKAEESSTEQTPPSPSDSPADPPADPPAD